MIIDVSKNQLDIGLVINDFKKKNCLRGVKREQTKIEGKGSVTFILNGEKCQL